MSDVSILGDLIRRLDETGPLGRAARDYLAEHRTRIRLRPQSSGARWTIFRNIELEPSQLKDDAYALSLLVHEVRHLKQGFFNALSVRGELEAWQEQFGYLKALTERYASNPQKEVLLEKMMGLSLDSRADLKLARALMRLYAGPKYRINLLPLYPLGKEIWYWVCLPLKYARNYSSPR